MILPTAVRPRPAVTVAGAAAVLAAAVAVTTIDRYADGDLGLATLATGVPWWAIAAAVCLLAATIAHYLLGATALRLVSGLAIPLPRATLAQLAAAAANRLAPAGLGATAVNVRFVHRSGLPAATAAGRVAALSVLGALGDLGALAALLALGPLLGVGGGTRELHTLAHAGLRLHMVSHLGRTALLASIALLLVVAVAAIRRHRRSPSMSVRSRALDIVRSLRDPRRAAGALGASAGTTIVLAAAFAVCTRAFTGSPAPVGALMTAYFVAGAVAGAAPLPAVVGPAEAALTAALVATGVPASHALPAVLAFRAVTFWAPVPVGAWALRRLRRLALL